jgi:hypothetical protein
MMRDGIGAGIFFQTGRIMQASCLNGAITIDESTGKVFPSFGNLARSNGTVGKLHNSSGAAFDTRPV